MFSLDIPQEIQELLSKLEVYQHESYIIGQEVADLILGREPYIWKVITNASYQEIVQIFPQTFFTATNDNHVTVVVWQRPIEVISLGSLSLQQYLSSYSFSLETLAYDWKKREIIDFFSATNDLKKENIRLLSCPVKIFQQQPVEMLRTIRLGAQYEFFIPDKVIEEIRTHHILLKQVHLEKVRDELALILLAPKPSVYLNTLALTKIIELFLPEIEEALHYQIGKDFSLGKHLFLTVDYLPPDLEVRLIGLFHDLGKILIKPTLRGEEIIYPGHEDLSAQIGKKILNRLNFFTKVVGHSINHHKIISVIRNHMFSYNPSTTTDKGIERLIARVGIENIQPLLELRKANILAGSQAKQSRMSFYHSLEKHLKRLLQNYN